MMCFDIWRRCIESSSTLVRVATRRTLSPRATVRTKSRPLTFSEHVEHLGFRGPGFDRIRLIAAIIVVLHHCSTYSVRNIADDFLSAATGGAIDFGRLAVNIFFVTSGVLVAPGLLRSGNVVTFAVNRAVRIMPALIIVVILTVFLVGPVITTLTAKQYFSDPETYLYLKNITFRAVRYLPGVVTADGTAIIVNGPLWTIYFEILSYGALALMFLAGITRHPRSLLIVFAVTYAIYVYSYATVANPLGAPDTLLVFSQLFVYFLAGVIFSAIPTLIRYSGKIATFFALASLFSIPLGIVYFTFPITLSYMVAYVGYSNLFGRKNLKIDLSYGIYLIHAVVLTFLVVMVPQIDGFFLATAVVMLFTVPLSLLSWNFIENPSLRRKKVASDTAQRLLDLLRGRWSRQGKSRGSL